MLIRKYVNRHIFTSWGGFAALLLPLIIVSCASDEMLADKSPIRLSATNSPVSTRADISIQNSAFEEFAKINAYIINHATGAFIGDPTIYTASEAVNSVNELSPNVQPYYPGGDATVDIYALYPGGTGDDAVNRATTSFTVESDQTSDANYRKSDLMYAVVSNQVKIDRAINLTFNHLMAKFIVHGTSDEGVVIQQIRINNVNRTVALTASSGELGALSNPGDIIISNDGAALLPPQNVNGTVLVVETNFGPANFNVDKTFESGNEYTMNLMVSRQCINNTTTITDWNSDIGTIAIVQASGGLEMADIASCDYTGEEIKPTPEVSYSGTVLTKDEDYTLQYFANLNVGTATVVAIGKKNEAENRDFTGQAAIKTFIIRQGTGSLSYAQDAVTQVYSLNAPVNNVLTKTGDGTMTFTSSNTDVARVTTQGEVTVRGIGTATITAMMASDHNYTGAEASYTLEVTKRPTSMLSITMTGGTSYTYTGETIKPFVEVKDGSVTLEEDTHYTISYSNNLNVGTATVTVTGIGVYSGDTPKEFTINKATTVLDVATTSVTMNAGSVIVRQGTTNFGTITYSSSHPSVATVGTSGSVTGVGNGTSTITVAVAETENWTGASKTYQVTVLSTETVFEYTGTIQEFVVPATGTYKLEVYGAKGGDFSGMRTTAGGNGGYATGTVTLSANQKLYIVVGGQGGTANSQAGGTGGYNGGGAGGNGGSRNDRGGGGGGGASHIAKVTGLLSAIGSTSNVLIIAGGGGGATSGIRGGTGGGEKGGYGYVNGVDIISANQTSGYQFGQGQSGANGSSSGGGWFSRSTSGSGGGGGGLYGGPANTNTSSAGSGSGGSGYIGGVSSSSMNNGARKGNGYVKITYIP